MELMEACLTPLTIIGAIGAFALLAWVFLDGLRPFAGKNTTVSFNVAVSLTVALSLAVNLAQFVKGRKQKSTIRRMRSRTDELEAQLAPELAEKG